MMDCVGADDEASFEPSGGVDVGTGCDMMDTGGIQ